MAQQGSTLAKRMAWLQGQLRNIARKWAPKSEAKKNAWVSRGRYLCNGCSQDFHYDDIQLDHIEPVIDPSTGFTSWDDYINRLFCDTEGYQVLCKPCHQEKTNRENAERT